MGRRKGFAEQVQRNMNNYPKIKTGRTARTIARVATAMIFSKHGKKRRRKTVSYSVPTETKQGDPALGVASSAILVFFALLMISSGWKILGTALLVFSGLGLFCFIMLLREEGKEAKKKWRDSIPQGTAYRSNLDILNSMQPVDMSEYMDLGGMRYLMSESEMPKFSKIAKKGTVEGFYDLSEKMLSSFQKSLGIGNIYRGQVAFFDGKLKLLDFMGDYMDGQNFNVLDQILESKPFLKDRKFIDRLGGKEISRCCWSLSLGEAVIYVILTDYETGFSLSVESFFYN